MAEHATCDSREARDIELNPERERERNTLVFAYCNSSNVSHPHHATTSLVRRTATLTFSLSRATVEPLVHCVSQTVKSPISQTGGATPCGNGQTDNNGAAGLCAGPAEEHCSGLAARM